MLRTLLLLITLSVTTSGQAQLTNGMIAHWNFNGNFNDNSGNNHNGTTSNNVIFGNGKLNVNNSAAIFNGTNSYISVPYKSTLNVNRFSICAVVKPTRYYNGPCHVSSIIERGKYFTSGTYAMHMFENPYDNDNCSKQDTSKYVFEGHCGNVNVNNANWAYSPNIVSNTWYCVVLVYDSTHYNVYIDGQLKSTVPALSGTNVPNSTDGLYIGSSYNANQISGYQYWFNGYIDDIRIYDRPLSATDVSSYCGGFDTTAYITNDISKTVLCSDDTLHLKYDVTKKFNSGNVFTAQLSDGTGSFITPVNVGTLTTDTAGTIICTIPTSLPPASGYRLRIVSSNPVRTSDVSSAFAIHASLNPTVSISAIPGGPVSPNTFIMFTATAVDAGTSPSYQWYRNGQAVSGANSNIWSVNTLNDGDSVYVQVTSSNMCPPDQIATSNTIKVEINTSVNQLYLNDLNLYPNPNEGHFILSANNIEVDVIKVEVINALGLVVYNDIATPVKGNLKEVIKINNITPGIYILKLSANTKQRVVRFTIK